MARKLELIQFKNILLHILAFNLTQEYKYETMHSVHLHNRHMDTEYTLTTSNRKVFSRRAPMQPVNPIMNIKVPARMSNKAGSSGI